MLGTLFAATKSHSVYHVDSHRAQNNLQIATADETTSMRSFGAPTAADQTHTPRQTGASLDARAKEFVIRSERTTPDPLINIKLEDEAGSSI